MSHSTTLVVLPGTTPEHEIEDAVEAALDPFDENIEMPEYIRRTRQELIDDEREGLIRYRDEGCYAAYMADPEGYAEKNEGIPEHLEYLREEFPKKLERLGDEEWLYKEATKWHDGHELDADGNELSTYNPRSKWDWYSIGGRWSGLLNQVDREADRWTGVNCLRKRELREPVSTFAFLGLDGEWHERGSMGWWGMVSDEKDTWPEDFQKLLDGVGDDDWLVVVDVHI